MRFCVRMAFLRSYPVQTVGAATHQEYWIPAEDLAAFNAQIVGQIEVLATFRRPSAPRGSRTAGACSGDGGPRGRSCVGSFIGVSAVTIAGRVGWRSMPAPSDAAATRLNAAVSRLNRVGQTLVTGPRAIHPPPVIDDFGWLEPDLRLLWLGDGGATREAVSVFTDDTVNRDADFLAPLLRHAVWRRGADLERLRSVTSRPPGAPWPSVDVRLSAFERQRAAVDERLRALQRCLCRLPFIESGLVLDRMPPHFEWQHTWGARRVVFLEIYSRTGAQVVTYESPPLEQDPLTALFFDLFDYLTGIIEPLPLSGWRETYDWDLTARALPPRSWQWDYRPPAQSRR
jgi:hypothetical protein